MLKSSRKNQRFLKIAAQAFEAGGFLNPLNASVALI